MKDITSDAVIEVLPLQSLDNFPELECIYVAIIAASLIFILG